MLKIGVIGYGERISSVISTMLQCYDDITISSICDVDVERVKSRMNENGLDGDTPVFYNDPDRMLDKEDFDGVLVGTRCSLHAEMGMKVMKRNIPLFLEKPLATNMKDLLTLKNAAKDVPNTIVVSFPLRVTPLVQLAKEIVDSGKLGTVEHVQAVNNVHYGGVYFHDWYRDEHETGGLFLQKATHDFDYINYLLGITPVEICAMKSKQIFKGDKPDGLSCADCADKNTCPEGPFVMKCIKNDDPRGEMCCFAKDTGNEDSGSAIIRYETGMHVNYTQNFFARKKAGKRGARLLGYNGTLEFDWYTDELKVFMHNTDRVESYSLESSETGHSGGDQALVKNFVNVMKGSEESLSPLDAGLTSVLMCLKAKESAETSSFQRIEWPC